MAAEHARRLGHLPRARDPRRAAVLDARTAGCITPQSAPHLHTFHIAPSHPQAAALSTYDASYYSLLTASYQTPLTTHYLLLPTYHCRPSPRTTPLRCARASSSCTRCTARLLRPRCAPYSTSTPRPTCSPSRASPRPRRYRWCSITRPRLGPRRLTCRGGRLSRTTAA